MHASHEGRQVRDRRARDRVLTHHPVYATQKRVDARRPLDGLVLAFEAGQGDAADRVWAPFQHGQGQMGAIADAPQVDLVHAEMATQVVDIVGALFGVVAAHGDPGAGPVDPGLLHLVAIPAGHPCAGHGWERPGGGGPFRDAGGKAGAALIEGDDVGDLPQGHEDREPRTRCSARAFAARPSGQIDDGRSGVRRGRGEAYVAETDPS